MAGHALGIRHRVERSPSSGVLMLRWMLLYSILLVAVWAFLGSGPE